MATPKRQKKSVAVKEESDSADDELKNPNKMLEIINRYKTDSINFIIGDVNDHCNKRYRMPNDNWYAWTDNLIKSITVNKEALKCLLKRDGHQKITDMCRSKGGYIWKDENALGMDGSVVKNLKRFLDDLELRIESSKLITRWCILKKKTALQLTSEKYNISKNGATVQELKDFILNSKKNYYNHKKEKYDILYEYYKTDKY